jgi:hypothetical protein
VVIDAVDTALQDREIFFCRVCVSVAANVFFCGVNDGAMAFEFLAYALPPM